LNRQEKLAVAHQLAALKVDVMEAGFPFSSPEDFESVRTIAAEVQGPVICGLARTTEKDIDSCWNAVKDAEKARIHTFIGTSPIHREKKLRKTADEVFQMAVNAVRFAKERCEDVEFSAEDSTRTEPEYLRAIVEAVIEAGATTVNLPDTVGYTVPWLMEAMIRDVMENVPNAGQTVISVHNHNDLGLAVANSLAAIQAGAGQVECTINGMGERAGNASLEEIVMTLRTRHDVFDVETGIDTRQIAKTSRMVSSLTGFTVQPNKAIVGANAFAHEAGIHQHGMLRDRGTYEIMQPEDVGLSGSVLTLGPRSGRHGVQKRLEELGYHVPDDRMDDVYARFVKVADRKKQVYDEDLEAIMRDASEETADTWRLLNLQIVAGTTAHPTATVELEKAGKRKIDAAVGNGPVDAATRAIERITGVKLTLDDYQLRGITKGRDAMGEATVRVHRNGEEAVGKAASTDIVEASAKAYLNAVNKIVVKERGKEK
jgi:2-isopropylmalate synthase